ncbi:putative serine/threonine-protein kinase WNK5 [Iris pallida]|uniref:non-specific serine/threonine protein kinase n=1 Tax=Iris pallida TaxID=29817 RepID=A0AAX6H752_IRIPA|nr:putative serine/threonine-protein kinase WNK5 [Iris pallida]
MLGDCVQEVLSARSASGSIPPIRRPADISASVGNQDRHESKTTGAAAFPEDHQPDQSQEAHRHDNNRKMNPEDDTIFLKVQIADKDGQVRNIYFPFDIYSDTAIDVANEMVRELEITDRDPSEIAEVIAQEISTLVPQWKDGGEAAEDRCHHEYSYKDDADEGQPTLSTICRHLTLPVRDQFSARTNANGAVTGTGALSRRSWLGDELFHNDDDETSSIHSGKYSAVNYSSGNEHDDHSHNQSQAQPNCHKHQKSTRFCPEESIQVPNLSSLATKFQRVQCNAAAPEGSAGSRGGKRPVDHDCLTRNRSFVDIRSQLLHRTLVEELNRRRMFKTVGAVENIGFQMPCDGGSRTGPSSSSSKGGHRKQWHGWGRS